MKFVYLFFALITVSCTKDLINKDYLEWKAKRKNALSADDGYLNLAGLYHISNGSYSMGSGKSNDIKLPKVFPDKFARIYVTDSTILYEYYQEVNYKDSIKTKRILINNYNVEEVFSWQTFKWYVHVDSGVKAIRLRDLNHPLLDEGIQIDFFPYNKDYIINAKFELYEKEKEVQLFNVLGGSFKDTIPGKITFFIDNKQYMLEPTISASGNFFIVFGDLTNSHETYGGGRFLYASPPDLNGNIILNFNKAYNPPCVFSSFTTCPIPSSNNIINISIEAGEKNYNGILFSSVYE